MIVKFDKTFHVPGFGRRRFKKGIVHDVPEALRNKLPSSAVVLPDTYKEPSNKAADDEKIASDYLRAAAEGTDRQALIAAGMAGFEDASQEPAEAEAKKEAARQRMANARAAKEAKKQAKE